MASSPIQNKSLEIFDKFEIMKKYKQTEKVVGWWITSRSGWLLELLTELTNGFDLNALLSLLAFGYHPASTRIA